MESPSSPAPRSERGFALIATLTLLPLLAMLVIGLLSLSNIAFRTSGPQAARLEARANARLALMLAIGELQKQLGPDQRVSADSRIFGNPSSGSSNAVSQPHWVNVWRSTMPDGSPVIRRDDEDGGLRDQRVSSGWDAERDRIGCLVSGNEDGMNYYEGRSGSHLAEDMVEVVGEGSALERQDRVSAPRIAVMEGKTRKGSYAWWVGDQGIKANVATRDASKRSKARGVATQPLQLAQDFSFAALENQGELADERRSKMVTTGQLDFAADKPGKVARQAFHDFTTESSGLLTDVREGGWRKDLTAFLSSTNGSVPDLNSGGVTMAGVNDTDRLVGPRNSAVASASTSGGKAARTSETSPDFGLLRDWAQRSETTTDGNYQTDVQLPVPSRSSINGRNQLPSSFVNREKNDLMPVLVEGALYYNVSYYEDAGTDAKNPYGLRLHLYPRVTLWNPYNFTMKVPASMIFMHLNGKKQIEVTTQDAKVQGFSMYWGLSDGASGGSQQGSMFFKLDGATLGPGQSLVWSPQQNRPYDEAAFSNNLLSASVGPATGRSFYQDKRADGFPLFRPRQTVPPRPGLANNRIAGLPVEWREYVPPRPAGDVQAAGYTQADDYLMLWKPISGSASSINLDSFGKLPQGRFVSCAYQYGDEDEMPVEWSYLDPVPMPRSGKTDAVVNQAPDRRTRDGFRLRWFDEHPSNRIGSGSLAGTPHLEDSPISTWNMRASYSLRGPFENVTDVAPNFFGIYTRDLFDEAIDWNNLMPRYEKGLYRGDPFDQPVRAGQPRILFDLPRRSSEIISLGALQHAKFSDLIWHPTYPFGNSMADPRIERICTTPRRSLSINKEKGGWNQDSIGYALDGRSNPNDNTAVTKEDNWAYSARSLLLHVPENQEIIFDLSYELNHTLWDGFFLSTGRAADKNAFLADPEKAPLPNGRLRPNPSVGAIDGADLNNFHLAASKLLLDGAFNVNSASEKAWEALLLSSLGEQHGNDRVTFPRIYGAPGGDWTGKDASSEAAWSGQRTFSRDEIKALAREIVVEVKTRGPFLSLSDFVNRRLRNDETGKKGALQAAIDRAGLNDAFIDSWPLDNRTALPNYKHPDHIQDPTRLDQQLKPSTTAWGALGFLTQADLLQFIGPAIASRSDTFVVRAYGNSLGKDGETAAEAWCEATVQRTPVPLHGDRLGLNPVIGDGPDFGRKFTVVRFRWLQKGEV